MTPTSPSPRVYIGKEMHVHYCRGIVTADVLAKGLSRRAIATRKLKGVNRDKGHERFYTSSVPYDEGKSGVQKVVPSSFIHLMIIKRNPLTRLIKSC